MTRLRLEPENERFNAGGCSFEVVSPFEELAVRYEGKLVLLDEPEEDHA